MVFDRARRPHTHDAQIGFFPCGYNEDVWQRCLFVDPRQYFDDVSVRLAPNAESVIVLANPVQPHSEGEIVLKSADPADHPDIRMNYFGDPHDMPVMLAVMRRVLDVVAHWPSGHAHRPPARSAVSGQQARAHRRRHAERRTARRPGPSLFVDGLPPDDELPDRQCRGPGTARDRGRSTARGRRERDAQRGERQHERGVDHDRREGGGDAGRRSRRATARSRRQGCTHDNAPGAHERQEIRRFT